MHFWNAVYAPYLLTSADVLVGVLDLCRTLGSLPSLLGLCLPWLSPAWAATGAEFFFVWFVGFWTGASRILNKSWKLVCVPKWEVLGISLLGSVLFPKLKPVDLFEAWLAFLVSSSLFLLFEYSSTLIIWLSSGIAICFPDLLLPGSGGVSKTITHQSSWSSVCILPLGSGVLFAFCLAVFGMAPFSGVCWTWIKFSKHDACRPCAELAQSVVERLSGSVCVRVRAQLLMKSQKDLMLFSINIPCMSLAQKWFGRCEVNKRRQLLHWNSAR